MLLSNVVLLDKYEDLNYNEMKTLMMIRRFPNKFMSFYSDDIMLENSSFTYLAKKLQKEGYIEIKKSNIYKRAKIIQLTEIGEQAAIAVEKNND